MPHPLTACLLAFAFYSAAALAFQAYVFTSRTSLPEPDDAYSYVLKSPQFAEGCGLQDCPALSTLRTQFVSKGKTEAAEWLRYRMETRLYLVYHPLYSGLLLALNKAGFGWEQAFIAVSYLGVLLIAAGIAFFLVTLWGPAAAALALVILAFCSFPGQGLTSIVPSTLTLGLAFFAWGFALRRWRWGITALILAMLLMHPIGKLYSVVALALALAIDRDFRPGLPKLLPYLVALALLGASVLVPMLVTQPPLRIEPEPIPVGFTVLGGLFANLRRAVATVRGFGHGVWVGLPLALAMYWLAWKGTRNAPQHIRRPAVIAFAAIGGMCLLLLGHVMPHYPAEGFIRGWIALAVLITGAASFALVGPNGILSRALQPGAQPWRNPAAIACLAFLGVFALSGTVVLAQHAARRRERHYQTFEPDQVRLLTERCGTALHADETAILFYLSHGANACPSVYLPALKGDAATPLAGFKAPLMLVAAKPGAREIAVARSHPAELTIADQDATRLYLKLMTSSRDATVQIQVAGQGEARKIAVGLTGRVIALDLPPGAAAKTITLATTSRFDEVYLEGMSINREASGWPWNHKVTLSHRQRSYVFSAPELTHGLFSSMKVIDSRGSTLLAELPAPN